MGISNLLKALKDKIDHVHLRKLAGKTAAIDTLCWYQLHSNTTIMPQWHIKSTPPKHTLYTGCTRACMHAALSCAQECQPTHTSSTAWTALHCCCATTFDRSWCLTAATCLPKAEKRTNGPGEALWKERGRRG